MFGGNVLAFFIHGGDESATGEVVSSS